jgi:hypothetical protein
VGVDIAPFDRAKSRTVPRTLSEGVTRGGERAGTLPWAKMDEPLREGGEDPEEREFEDDNSSNDSDDEGCVCAPVSRSCIIA